MLPPIFALRQWPSAERGGFIVPWRGPLRAALSRWGAGTVMLASDRRFLFGSNFCSAGRTRRPPFHDLCRLLNDQGKSGGAHA